MYVKNAAVRAEIEGLLIRMRGILLAAQQDEVIFAELSPFVAEIRDLRQSVANEISSPAVAILLQRFEAELDKPGRDEQLSSQEVIRYLDLVANIEAALSPFDHSSDIDDSDELLDLVEKTFKDLTPTVTAQISVTVPDEDEFEIDAELIEVFASEAEDLLRAIENSLDELAAHPDNREALWEIRRNAHTLKGAAGIVGLKKASQLAHRVEDMLDRLGEGSGSSNETIFALLQRSAQAMRELTASNPRHDIGGELEQLNAEFDSIGEILSDPGLEDGTGLVPDLSEAEKTKSTAASVSGYESTITSPLKRERGRPIVRVSLEKLDDLVRIVREIVVSRSAIEQRLFDFDQQIDDLHNSTRRLQDVCAKMEIDFESSMLHKGSQSEQKISPFGRSQQNEIVDVELFDPLELDRYTDFHESTRVLSETTSDTATINSMLDALRENFDQLFDRQRRLIDEMQDRLMRIRMVEFGTLETRLQRVVRVTCEEEEKKAEVTIENALIEIDTQILDALIEPLMHLLKNAIVHGIESPGTRRLLGKSETGSIKISLLNEDTHIVMSVADDGRGIATFALKEEAVRTGLLDQSAANAMNEEKLFDLIFLPGLTTAKKLNLSAGRGVGMSIVKESIESQNGTISVKSQPQHGTTFTVKMPLPLAVTTVVLVNAQGRTYAIPARHLDHIDTFDGRSQHPSKGLKSVTRDGVNYRVEFLNVLAAVSPNDETRKENNCVLFLRSLTDPLAVVVDDVIRSEEIVIKSLSCPLDRIKGILGAALLGSGELVPILDLREMTRSPIVKNSPPLTSEIENPLSVLIIDDSPSVRTMTARVITNAGWNAETAKDGVEALAKLKESRQVPDLILSDIEMPRMDGFEFVAALRESPVYTDVPVIFITSRSSEKHREKAFASGVQEYLTKPFNDRELTSMIRKLSLSRQRPAP